MLEVFPVQSAVQVKKPNALRSISVQPPRPGEELYLEFVKISTGIKMWFFVPQTAREHGAG